MELIAYIYSCDYHCPTCALRRWGRCEVSGDIACTDAGCEHEPAEDGDGPVSAVFGCDDWCSHDENTNGLLYCGSCDHIITECGCVEEREDEDEDEDSDCDCDVCNAMAEEV